MLSVKVTSVELRGDGTPVVLLREIGREDGPALCVFPSRAEAHDLMHEREGAETTRAQAHALLERTLRAVGARPAAVLISRSCESCLAARLMVEREGAWIDVEVETPQAIALADRLRLPLWADPDLFSGAAVDSGRRHLRS